MKIKEMLNEILITGVVHRLATEAIKEFGEKNSNPKAIYKEFYKSIDNEIKKEKLSKNKSEIIAAIRELRK